MLGFINKQLLLFVYVDIIRFKLIYSKNKFAII
jgi:hypothetical protein